MGTVRCTICGKKFDPAESPAMPFCSERCRRIDLGRWLGEEYGMPLEGPEEESPERGESDEE